MHVEIKPQVLGGFYSLIRFGLADCAYITKESHSNNGFWKEFEIVELDLKGNERMYTLPSRESAKIECIKECFRMTEIKFKENDEEMEWLEEYIDLYHSGLSLAEICDKLGEAADKRISAILSR